MSGRSKQACLTWQAILNGSFMALVREMKVRGSEWEVFVDSFGWIALGNRDDAYHTGYQPLPKSAAARRKDGHNR